MDLSGAKKKNRVQTKHSNPVHRSSNNPVTNHQININISLPSSLSIRSFWRRISSFFNKLFIRAIKFVSKIMPSKKVINITLFAVIALCSLMLVKAVFVDSKSNNNSDEVKGIEAEKKERPDFAIYYPSSQKEDEMSYDYKKKVASYPDQIDTIPITISQQKLPDTFKANPIVELEKLAKQINANTKLEAVGGINAFMGQSVRGPQTVVFVKDQTLIFIKSDSQVAISAWNNYLDSLTLQK